MRYKAQFYKVNELSQGPNCLAAAVEKHRSQCAFFKDRAQSKETSAPGDEASALSCRIGKLEECSVKFNFVKKRLEKSVKQRQDEVEGLFNTSAGLYAVQEADT